MTNTEKDEPFPGDAEPKNVQPLNPDVQPSISTQEISAAQALLDLGKGLSHIPENALLEDSDQSGGSRGLPVPPEFIALVELTALLDYLFGEDMCYLAEAILNGPNTSTGVQGSSSETVNGKKRKKRIDENEYEQGGNGKKHKTAQKGGEKTGDSSSVAVE